MSFRVVLRRLVAVGLICASAIGWSIALAQEPSTEPSSTRASREEVRQRFIRGAFTLLDAAGNTLGKRWIGSREPPKLAEPDVVAALTGHVLSNSDAAELWEMLAGESHASFLTLPLIEAAIAATVAPLAREAMWGELAALSDRLPRDESDPTHAASLIGLLERHRSTLHARIVAIAETVGGGDEMIRLMLGTRVFGASVEEAVTFMVRVDPAALHRRIERDRSAGKPVTWQNTASMLLAPWYEAQRSAEAAGHTAPLLSKAEVRHRFIHGAFALLDAMGGKLGNRYLGDAHLLTLSEPEVIAAFKGHHLTRQDAAAVWEMLASEFHASLLTLPLLQAIVSATDTPYAREALWSELSGLAMRFASDERARASSLLGLFERHAEELKPLLKEVHESEGGGDEMVKLMLAARVFGAGLPASLAFVAEHSPAALARKIERERSAGKPVAWERTAFDLLLRWKSDRLLPGAGKAPTTLGALDAAGEQLVAILNGLHDFDDRDRGRVIEGLGPAEVFNVIVAGERELYRLGTSSYRKFLHPVVAAGLEKAGSLEAFLQQATVERLGEEAIRATGRRAVVFLRVASSFGLIDTVLERVRDRDRFIDMAIASLGDAAQFEANSSVLMDVLTVPSGSRALAEFKRILLARLYERYGAETDAGLRSVYGSMLSVYQTVTADRRDKLIDRDFLLDSSIFEVPFDRLFTASGHGSYTHRMFMRMDQDADAKASYIGFRALMRSKGAIHRDERTFEVVTLRSAGRSIEIYLNKPTAVGNKKGIADIAAALAGRRVETVIGRGHTHIIAPLQADSRRILGDRIREVAAVLVGACGGDASVREMIATFGYKPFFATKATGRAVINNAIIENYISALLAMRPGERVSMPRVLARALAPMLRSNTDAELRTDASLYEANTTTVYTAYLFNAHVRRHAPRVTP